MKELLVSVPLVAAAGFRMLGQAGPLVDPGISTLIGNLGIMGVLVWYLWYHTTHSYPTMLEKFANETKAIREAFKVEQDAARAANARENDELRKMLIQTLGAMRNAVHDVRDTAQTAVNSVAAAKLGDGQARGA